MKKQILALFLLMSVSSCSSTNVQEIRSSRTIANDEDFNMKQLIDHAEKLLKLANTETTTSLKLINYPLMRPDDVGPGNALRTLEDISTRYQLESEEDVYMNYWMNADSKPLEKGIKENLVNSFSRPERDKLLSLCFLGPTHVGSPVWISGLFARDFCRLPHFLHTRAEVAETLNLFPASPKDVKYIGSNGYHDYSDPKLENLVQILVAQINKNKDEFYNLFHSQPKSVKAKFQIAKDDSSESSKIEPFDLISTYSVKYIVGTSYGQNMDLGIKIDKIQISKMIQKSLAWLFHLDPKQHSYLINIPSLTLLKGDSRVQILCTKGMMPNQRFKTVGRTIWNRGSFGSDLVESWLPNMDLRDLTKSKKGFFSFSCNTIDYNFSYSSIESTPLPFPQEFKFNDGEDIHALMTISLVHEINKNAVSLAKMITTMFSGWKVVDDIESVDSEKYIKDKLTKADAYFPVMHSMDLNYFNMGTRQGLAVTLKKQIKSSTGKRTVYLSILFPDGSNVIESLIYKSEDLSQILNERYKVKNKPLFLMNNSCNSDITLLSWIMVYRKALEKRNISAPMNDFPHIIGSRRAFGTSNIIEIFSHSKYPMHSLEILASGGSIDEIMAFLKSPTPDSTLNKVIGFFSDKSVPEGTSGFDPVYVMEYPELLTSKGIEFKMQSRAIKGENSY